MTNIIGPELFEKALLFATKAHSGVVRKGNKRPYIVHPLAVMATVWKYKKSTNPYLLGIVALLHDTVEDNPDITLEIIAKEFGYQVAALVEELTLDKEQYEILGKKEYLARELVSMTSYAFYIKLADRYNNVVDMEDMPTEFQRRYTEETYFILQRAEEQRPKITGSQNLIIQDIKKELKKYSHLIQE